MTRILLLNDTRDHDNWGSRACADGLCRILERTIQGVRIRSIPSAWTTRRYRQAPRLLGGRIYERRRSRWGRLYHRVSRDFPFLPTVADEFEATADDWLEGRGGPGAREYLEALDGVDAVVFNAEGATYRTNDSAIKCLFALWLARTRCSVPAVFLNGTVHLTGVDPVLPAMVRKCFAVLDGIAVREPQSLASLSEHAPGIRAEVVPDTVFQFTPELAAEARPAFRRWRERLGDRPYFCLSLSMLLSAQRGYQRHGAQGSALAHLIRSLRSVVPEPVLMARDGMDQRIVRELAAATGAHFFGPENTYADLLALLNDASFLVSGRYHHLIFGAVAGCPALPLRTTSHKVDGLCRLVDGVLGEPFDPTDLFSETETMTERARELVAHRERHGKRLVETAAALRDRTGRLGELVGEAAERSSRPGVAP
ncbi:MAG: polysaccharide pyruvyl transferase family protein [Thermoanaerobaculia bacterium]